MKSSSYSIILIACQFISLVPFVSYSQPKSLAHEPEWFDGSVTLKSNNKLSGYIQNNDKLGLIKFKPTKDADNSEIQSFNEKTILALEYFDQQLNDYRRFYSFNCKSDQTGFNGVLLFEVVKEFKDFAVLARKTRVDLIGKDNSGMEGYSKSAGLITGQREGFFCVGESGELELFLLIEYTEKDGIMFDKSKSKTKYEKPVIKKYLGDYWEKVEAFGDDNNLRFSQKNGILPLLEYYELLVSGN